MYLHGIQRKHYTRYTRYVEKKTPAELGISRNYGRTQIYEIYRIAF